jgi:glutamate-1-semialdehyde 2,1-aminomutase
MRPGYDHPVLRAPARRAAEKPLTYGAQHELEITVAERLQALIPCAQRIVFSSSGSEVVQLVHRLCRAYTKRELILKSRRSGRGRDPSGPRTQGGAGPRTAARPDKGRGGLGNGPATRPGLPRR